MRKPQLTWVFIGLSITSSWGNGHATTYRSLLSAMRRRGHRIIFLERAAPWYRSNADMPSPAFCETIIYDSLDELVQRYSLLVESADACVLGSYVPDGAALAEFVTASCDGVTAFYDIDTPVTLRSLEEGKCTYLTRSAIPKFDLYLSFTGGTTLKKVCDDYAAKRAEPLYCSVDPELYYPEAKVTRWNLGYLGTYSIDRQQALDRLLCAVAHERPLERFIVAGPQYPAALEWPPNVDRVEHISPRDHREFYCAQRATLNVTRQDMVQAGCSPSVRLFEAAACGTPIISDVWTGIDKFFVPGEEILLAENTDDVLRHLEGLSDERRQLLGQRARARVLREHSAAERAASLEAIIQEIRNTKRPIASRARTRAIDNLVLSREVER